MFAHTRKLLWAVTLLSVTLGGCRSAPPLPAGVNAQEYNKPVPDSWLFPRLMGRDPQPANPAPTGVSQTAPGTQATSGSQVVATSATETVTDPTTHATIVPPAGSQDDPLSKREKEDEEESGFLEDLYPTNIYKNMKKMAGYGPDEKIARAAFDEAEALYAQKKFAEAAPKYATAASRWPDSTLEEDALFQLGECYFFTDQVSKAYDTYNKLLKKYEFSRHMDTAVARLFSIGRYWDDFEAAEPHWPTTPNLTDDKRPLFDTWGHAIKAYEQARLNDPTGPLADDSVMATGNTYFKYGRWEDAAYNYDIIRKEYPKSEHQVRAHILGVQSKMHVYQGPMYDGTPLTEAEAIAQQALTQFPEQLGPEKQRMIQTKNEIIAEQAQREWQLAQYYDGRKYYGAARIYYREVIKSHPQTKFAEMAQARLEEIKDLPAEPPNRFKLLTDLFQRRDTVPQLREDRAPAPTQ